MGLIFLLVIILIVFVIYNAIQQARENEFNNSSYHEITGNAYRETIHDKGKAGEYLIYKELRFMENDGCRFLFNLYLPRNAWGSETTEIDLIAITHYGVIVFESKNYGGWIFGDERSEKWCQTLRASKYTSTKQFFYNPIKQNRNHIAVLKRVLEQGGIANVPTWNIVVFSKHCELKKMSWTSSDVAVVKINDLGTALDRIQAQGRPVVSDDVLGMIYGLLFPYSQANDEIKARHVERIRSY